LQAFKIKGCFFYSTYPDIFIIFDGMKNVSKQIWFKFKNIMIHVLCFFLSRSFFPSFEYYRHFFCILTSIFYDAA